MFLHVSLERRSNHIFVLTSNFPYKHFTGLILVRCWKTAMPYHLALQKCWSRADEIRLTSCVEVKWTTLVKRSSLFGVCRFGFGDKHEQINKQDRKTDSRSSWTVKKHITKRQEQVHMLPREWCRAVMGQEVGNVFQGKHRNDPTDMRWRSVLANQCGSEYGRKDEWDVPCPRALTGSDWCCPTDCVSVSDRRMSCRGSHLILSLGTLYWCCCLSIMVSAEPKNDAGPPRRTCILHCLRTPVEGNCLKNDTGADILLVSYWSHLQSDWFCVMPPCPAEMHRPCHTHPGVNSSLSCRPHPGFLWAHQSYHNKT